MTRLLPPSLRGRDVDLPRVLSTRDARNLGMSKDAMEHAIAAFGWQRLTRGFLLTAPGSPTRADWINVGLALAAPTGAISGWDAIRMVGLGEKTPPAAAALVLAREGENRVVGGVRIRPTTRPFTTWLLPGEHPDHPYCHVASVARAVADTARQYRQFRAVRALVTSAVQRKRCTAEDLISELELGPRNHSAHLRRAVADLRAGARSVAEAEAIDILRRSPVPRFEANVPIVTVSGRHVADADCLWRELRAVLEIDSRQFHFEEEDWEATMARHSVLGRYGLAVDHCSPKQIRRDNTVWARGVEQWLRARAADLQVAYRPAKDPLVLPAVPGKPAPFVVPDLPS
jgi:hypothetical protein